MYITCELKMNPTEDEQKLRKLMAQIVVGDPTLDKRFDGEYLVILTNNRLDIMGFFELIREQRLLDTVRTQMFKNMEYGSMTSLYFNKQALHMGRLSIVDFEDNPPLGAVLLQFVSEEGEKLEEFIDWLAPQTYKGKELTEEEWKEVKRREALIREKKKKEELKRQRESQQFE